MKDLMLGAARYPARACGAATAIPVTRKQMKHFSFDPYMSLSNPGLCSFSSGKPSSPKLQYCPYPKPHAFNLKGSASWKERQCDRFQTQALRG